MYHDRYSHLGERGILVIMDVLMITKDTNILREGSAARAAVVEEASLVNRMFVVVLTTHADHYTVQKVSDTLWFIPTNSWSIWLAPFSAARAARSELYFQGRLQADLIAAKDPLLAGLAGLYVSRTYRKPLHVQVEKDVFSPRFMSAAFSHYVAGFVARFVVRRAAGIRVASEHIRATLADLSASVADRAVILPEYIDIESFQNEPVRVNLAAKYPQFKFIILMVAHLNTAQNLRLAVNVLARVLRQYSYAGLVIVGEGSAKASIMGTARSLGVAEHLVIEPSSDNIISYYKTAHAFLTTALYDDENSLTIAQAGACSCPIVSSAIGVASSAITNGVTGFLCTPEDTDCYTAGILTLIKDEVTRAQMKVNIARVMEKNLGGNKQAYLVEVKKDLDRTLAKGVY